MSSQELPAERLATTAQDGSRVYLHTAEVRGKLRSLRNLIYDILLIIFLCMPWIRINGHPVLLLDIPNRHFSIFGLTFWGHDAPMLFLVFVSFVVTIGLITAIFGRGWCGWACPQTVFIDRLFLRIERWIEGSAIEQKKLDDGPMTAVKFFKKTLKWVLFLASSLVVTHSFLAYFVGTEKLAIMVRHSPLEHPASFFTILLTTAIVLFDFGWFREQFCVIACPYGRFQSVLMDENSLIVAYDAKRGEPRGKKGEDPSKTGDCVNCFRCVQVCPTGIDIRRGVQMECIACTACIDACDEVMSKIKRPAGLIRYDTEAGLEHKPVKHFRARTLIYSIVIIAAATALFFVVTTRELVKISFVHAMENPYQLVHDGQEVINHLKVNIHNQNTHAVDVRFDLPAELAQKNISLVTPISPLVVNADQSLRADLFITFPRSFLKFGNERIKVHIHSSHPGSNTDEMVKEVPLIGPGEN